MHKFIVYDRELKCFVTEDSDFDDLCEKKGNWNKENGNMFEEYNPYSTDEWFPALEILGVFRYFTDVLEHKQLDVLSAIGKKDINDKEIYADCSIVEFKATFSGGYFTTIKGYFYFDELKKELRVKLLGSTFRDSFRGIDTDSMKYDYEYMKDFKIIDTIQENKLGLYHAES